ncbi:MAG TPA: hypothetical protein VIN09_13290 [Chloroflexota bacterium]
MERTSDRSGPDRPCPRCGASVEQAASRCPRCGGQLAADPAPDPPPDESRAEEYPRGTVQPGEAREILSGWGILLTGVLLFFLGLTLLFFPYTLPVGVVAVVLGVVLMVLGFRPPAGAAT